MRVFIESPASTPLQSGYELVLNSQDSHHIARVLRLGPGGLVTVVLKGAESGAREYQAIITKAAELVHIKILQAIGNERSIPRVRCLAYALTKGESIDLVCEKACELGVEHIILWEAERSVRHITDEKQAVKLTRWQKIVESAAKQSGRDSLPSVQIVKGVDELVIASKKLAELNDVLITCSLSPAAQSIRTVILGNRAAHVVIGPEGDLTQSEEQVLLANNFSLVNLGPFVLRSETAAIAALSMLHALQ